MKKVVLITGATSGIGLELCKQFSERGYHVLAAGRNLDKASALKGLKEKFTSSVDLISLDVNNEKEIKGLATQIKSPQIDILINNAGVLLDAESNFTSLSASQVIDSFRTNTLGPILVTQVLLPLLRKSKDPRIAHITSLMGSIADNSSGKYYAYRMSKAALNMFNKSFKNDFPEMITLVIHPGWVETRMGGKAAPVKPNVSAKGIIEVIEKTKHKDSGSFYDYTGKSLPW